MKTSITKILLSCLVLMTLITTSCKKEKDDPNITQFTYNKTTTNSAVFPSFTIDSIDLNQDGAADLLFGTQRYTTVDSQYVQYEGNDLAIAVNDAPVYDIYSFVKLFSKDDMPPLYNDITENYRIGEYMAAKVGSLSFGADNKGDVYLAFGMKKSSSSADIYYGWIRINIAANYSSIKFLEGAISDIPNKTIAIGSK